MCVPERMWSEGALDDQLHKDMVAASTTASKPTTG
jgi:hypothetical protein